ncbi:hypothetical protein SAV31267_037910 [Streptomyces avermitilis]|uniref:Uncharacterized protein n=1 Tax=Streptomyces avermitilis TaxID=33903 RepID=A0A4D4MRB7_STRAX|nr:hypothetical protein SAV31267_037910 [Streptomyces avermitilis]
MLAIRPHGVRLDPDVRSDLLVRPKATVGHQWHLPARAAASAGTAVGEPDAALAITKPVPRERQRVRRGKRLLTECDPGPAYT